MILVNDSSKDDDTRLCYSCQDIPCELCSMNLQMDRVCPRILCNSSSFSPTINIKNKSSSIDSHRLSNEKDFSNRIGSISNILIFVMPLLLVLLL